MTGVDPDVWSGRAPQEPEERTFISTVSIRESTGGGFRVFEFFFPPPIAMLFDQAPRLGEVVLRGRPWVIPVDCSIQTAAPDANECPP